MLSPTRCTKQCRLSGLSSYRRTIRCKTEYSTRPSAPDYCLELVRRLDHDHYLCTLLLPRPAREAVFAFRAFNVEIAQIRDVVSEKHIGQMRIQFWRDTIDAVFKGQAPNQPIALALAAAIQRHKLSKLWFNRILDARERDLSTNAYSSTREMEEYADNTFSSLLYLTLEALGVKDVNADHAASHVGKAEGIVTLLRATAYHRYRRSVLIPMDIIMRHGASQEDFLRGTVTQAVEDATYDFASLAHSHLQKAHSLKDKIPPSATKALLPSVVCEAFLRRLQLSHFNPFESDLTSRSPLLPFSLLWRSWRKTY